MYNNDRFSFSFLYLFAIKRLMVAPKKPISFLLDFRKSQTPHCRQLRPKAIAQLLCFYHKKKRQHWDYLLPMEHCYSLSNKTCRNQEPVLRLWLLIKCHFNTIAQAMHHECSYTDRQGRGTWYVIIVFSCMCVVCKLCVVSQKWWYGLVKTFWNCWLLNSEEQGRIVDFEACLLKTIYCRNPAEVHLPPDC